MMKKGRKGSKEKKPQVSFPSPQPRNAVSLSIRFRFSMEEAQRLLNPIQLKAFFSGIAHVLGAHRK
jgi:hypothetical protein